MEYKTPKEVKKSIYEKKWYHHWRYFLFYCWWNWVEERPRKIKSFFQRGWRGWADEDTWNFDMYLAQVISEGVRHHKKYQTGIPSEYIEYKQNISKVEEKLALNNYHEQLKNIIDGFETYIKMCNNYKTNEKKYLIQKLKVAKGMDAFKDNFHNLND